jgi:hypothetical protein
MSNSICPANAGTGTGLMKLHLVTLQGRLEVLFQTAVPASGQPKDLAAAVFTNGCGRCSSLFRSPAMCPARKLLTTVHKLTNSQRRPQTLGTVALWQDGTLWLMSPGLRGLAGMYCSGCGSGAFRLAKDGCSGCW